MVQLSAKKRKPNEPKENRMIEQTKRPECLKSERSITKFVLVRFSKLNIRFLDVYCMYIKRFGFLAEILMPVCSDFGKIQFWDIRISSCQFFQKCKNGKFFVFPYLTIPHLRGIGPVLKMQFRFLKHEPDVYVHEFWENGKKDGIPCGQRPGISTAFTLGNLKSIFVMIIFPEMSFEII